MTPAGSETRRLRQNADVIEEEREKDGTAQGSKGRVDPLCRKRYRTSQASVRPRGRRQAQHSRDQRRSASAYRIRPVAERPRKRTTTRRTARSSPRRHRLDRGARQGFISSAASIFASTCPRRLISSAASAMKQTGSSLDHQRVRPDRRDRIGASQNTAARGARHPGRRLPATSTSGNGS